MGGYFVLSLDTEIAWGTFDKGGLEIYKKHFEAYRYNVKRLILLLEKYNIKATWAVVGHLFLDECDGKHEEVLRPRYSWYGNKDWHNLDPGTNIKDNPYWYGRDIVKMIMDSRVKHEIATHTFSHVVIGDPECTEDIAISQVEKDIEIAKNFDINISSIVFPRNSVGHLDAISKLGINCYRGVQKTWYMNQKGINKRACHFIDEVMSITPYIPKYQELLGQEKIVNIPASQFLAPYDGLWSIVPQRCRVKKGYKGIDKAIKDNGVYHLWFHPFNLGSSDKMFEDLENILKCVSDKIKCKELVNMTMQEMTEHIYSN